MNDYWIYEIRCVPSNKVYIGKTRRPTPFFRWSQHYLELCQRNHHSKFLQEEWDKYPDLTQWQFQTICTAIGTIESNHKEAELILNIPQELRLNTLGGYSLSLDKQNRVKAMLADGKKYIDIRDTLGVSLGTISSIKNKLYY